jgi:O-antigen/teichoic acid export membrane protein
MQIPTLDGPRYHKSFVEKLKAFLSVRALSSFLTKKSSDRGRERYRRASVTASTSFLSKALTIVISFVSVPLTANYLGPERYGIWLTISSLLTWMALTDFGLAGNALVNVIAEAHGNDNRKLAREYAASAFWALTAISLSIGAIFLISFHWISWRAVFRASENMSIPELHQACALTLAMFVLTLPLNMLNSIYNAYQDGFVWNVWTIVSNALALASLIAVTHFRGGLPILILAVSGTRVLVGLANGYYLFFRRYRWLMPIMSAVKWNCTKRLLNLGGKYMVTQLAALGIYQSQPMIITQVLGPSHVMVFVIAQRIITLPAELVYMATAPFISAYSEAKARGDWKWISGAFRHSTFASIGFGVTAVAVIAFAAKPVIRIWAGPAAVPDSTLILWLSVYTLVGVSAMAAGQMLCGLERVGVWALSLTLCALGTIGLGILFGEWWGLSGVALAMAAAKLFTFLPIQTFVIHRILRTFSIHAEQERRRVA